MFGQGRQPFDQAFHNGFGLSVWVLQHDCKARDTLDQRGHVGLAKFLSEHDQIAFPFTADCFAIACRAANDQIERGPQRLWDGA